MKDLKFSGEPPIGLGVERRREQREPVDEPILVTVLSSGQPAAIPGRILNLSGTGLKITLPGPAPIGAAVKIERRGELWLGEVVYVHQSAGECHIGIEVSQALRYTRDLENLREAIAAFQQSSAMATEERR
jgi:hypothetical protein